MNGFLATGGCQCGRIRYEVSEPAQDLYHCHCSMCRKVHGAMFGSYSIVPRSAFRLTSGSADIRSFESSPGVVRFFCGGCGCQIYCEDARRPAITFHAPGSLDAGHSPGHDPERERHVYVASKACWYEIGDGLPRFEEEG
jgi:hypothetical protein